MKSLTFHQPRFIKSPDSSGEAFLDECPVLIGTKIAFRYPDRVIDSTVVNVQEVADGWDVTLEVEV